MCSCYCFVDQWSRKEKNIGGGGGGQIEKVYNDCYADIRENEKFIIACK